jgi:hypothetical protein
MPGRRFRYYDEEAESAEELLNPRPVSFFIIIKLQNRKRNI